MSFWEWIRLTGALCENLKEGHSTDFFPVAHAFVLLVFFGRRTRNWGRRRCSGNARAPNSALRIPPRQALGRAYDACAYLESVLRLISGLSKFDVSQLVGTGVAGVKSPCALVGSGSFNFERSVIWVLPYIPYALYPPSCALPLDRMLRERERCMTRRLPIEALTAHPTLCGSRPHRKALDPTTLLRRRKA